MTKEDMVYLTGEVNDDLFNKLRAVREQVRILSGEKIHAERRIHNQRKELNRKDEQIKELKVGRTQRDAAVARQIAAAVSKHGHQFDDYAYIKIAEVIAEIASQIDAAGEGK